MKRGRKKGATSTPPAAGRHLLRRPLPTPAPAPSPAPARPHRAGRGPCGRRRRRHRRQGGPRARLHGRQAPGGTPQGRRVAVDLGIAGRRAAVAAASSGLGLATARALAAEGVRVVIGARSADKLEAAAASIDGDVIAVVGDVGTPEGATGWARAAAEALGGVDILVTNAGGPPPGQLRLHRPRRLRPGHRPEPAVGRGHVQGARATDAGAGLGPRGRHHLGVGAPAPPLPHPLEHGAGRGHRLPQDPRPRGRRRRRHGELRAARHPRHRPHPEPPRRRHDRRRRPTSPSARSAGPTTSARSWPSSAATRPASSPVPPCRSTAARCAACSSRSCRRRRPAAWTNAATSCRAMPSPRWSAATSSDLSSDRPWPPHPRATPTTAPRRRAVTTTCRQPGGASERGTWGSSSGHDPVSNASASGSTNRVTERSSSTPPRPTTIGGAKGASAIGHPPAVDLAVTLLLEEVDPVEGGLDHEAGQRGDRRGDALGLHVVGQR